VKTAAVFVHGLWLTGAESALMRRRLAARHGFECHSFGYRTTGRAMPDVIAQLAKFVERIDAEQVHFVGHSLGGLVLYRYFETAPCAQPGRVVFLGYGGTGRPPAATVVPDRPHGHRRAGLAARCTRVALSA
jgi:pimeloyl-ACP methyl ester carboxylesterase